MRDEIMRNGISIIKNPIDLQFMKIGFVASCLLVLWGVMICYTLHFDISFIISCLGAMFLFTIVGWREYCQRPTLLEMRDEGAVFHYRFRDDAFVPYSNMESILIERGNPDTAIGRFSTNGAIYIKGRFYPILVSADIAEGVRDIYRDRTGSTLPDYKAMRR